MEAEFVLSLCERFKTLPEAGGLLDQDILLLRYLKILQLGTPERAG
jgi:hypothetical protein